METRTQRRKPGPVPTPGRVRVTVYLDETLADWGKRQEGGLSDLMRRLLSEAQWREEGTPAGRSDPYPPELRAAYRRLIDRKLAAGLTAPEEAELEQVRARINAADRSSAAWRERELAADAIDAELAELRREIEAMPERGPSAARP